MGGRADEFPLFPLPVVALPNELVPLHIFEPRYRAMIAVCLDRELEFGIVWLDEEGEMRSTGCACRIDNVLRRFDDGRMDILTRGTRPLRVHGPLTAIPYPAGTIEFLDDKAEEPHPPTVEAAHDAYAELVREVTDEAPDRERLAGMDAYAMAATVELGLKAKQGLLDLRSENARLRLVTRLFRGAIRRLDYIDRATARARSNGKVRFG